MPRRGRTRALDRGRRRADVHSLDLVESSWPASRRSTARRPRRPWPRARRAPARRAARRRTRSSEARERVLDWLALLLGLRGEHRLQTGLQLLPDPRHGEEPRRADLRQVGEDLPRVRAAVTVPAKTSGGSGAPSARRCAPPAATRSPSRPAREVDDLLESPPAGEHDVVVRELDALRRARGARRVDQRQHVVGLGAGSRRSKSGSRLDIAADRPRAPRARPSPERHPAPRRRRRSRARGPGAPRAPRASPQERLLDDRHPRAGVPIRYSISSGGYVE